MYSPTGYATMSSAIEFADNYNRWIVNQFIDLIGVRVLEIGCGRSNYKNYLPPLDLLVSVDVDAEAIRQAKSINSNGIYLAIDVTDSKFVEELECYSFDTIICINVLEHILESEKAIEHMMNVLKRDGWLFLFVPAFRSLYSSMDELAGHVKRYDKRDVKKLFSNNEWSIERLEYFNPIGGFVWWLNKFVCHRELDSNVINMQIRLFDKYIVPISQCLNGITKSFFGQSLLCCIKKL